MTKPSLQNKSSAPILTVAGLLLAATLAAQVPSNSAGIPSSGNSSFTRACSTNPVLAPPTAKKSSHKLKHPIPPEPLPACLEVKGEGIEVQEFLQTRAREESWRIGENRASEDTWSFIRYFDSYELDRYAETKILLEPVDFTGGKAAVVVRTAELGDGYTRVQISTRFVGDGKSADKTWGQPTTSWKLNSKGVLEQEMVTALQTRYKPVQ